jgi:hypothetical protein
MGKIQSKRLPHRHGGGKAWQRHGICESSLRVEGSCSVACCWQRCQIRQCCSSKIACSYCWKQ